jgi:hypothetical protein
MLSRLWSYIRRPRLHLYFDPASTYHMCDDPDGATGYFCHVMVRNRGRATVRNCRGRLIEVSVRSPNGSTAPAHGFFVPVFLKWAREPDFDPRDLESDQARALDLCFTLASTPHQLRFFAPPSPSGVQILPPGVYAVRVTVSADNERAAHRLFRVDFTRDWNQIVVAEVSEV